MKPNYADPRRIDKIWITLEALNMNINYSL